MSGLSLLFSLFDTIKRNRTQMYTAHSGAAAAAYGVVPCQFNTPRIDKEDACISLKEKERERES